MKNFLIIASLLISFLGCVLGHAKLDTPTAWNPNPSKTFPCGGGAPQPYASVVWQQGTVQNLIWEVVAGDGVGPVQGLINVKAQTDFTSPVTLFTNGNSPALGQHTMTFKIPNIVCQGPNSTCLLQVSSSSGWVACSTISISNSSNSGPVENTYCVYGTEIQFCATKNAANVSIPLGTSTATVDLQVLSTYETNINNTNVFLNGADPNCQAAYKALVCDNGLPSCGRTSACQETCQNAVNLCSLTPDEANLYPCSTYPTCGNSGNAPLSVPLFLVALMMMLSIFYRLA